MNKKANYVDVLKKIIMLTQAEISKVDNGEESPWTTTQLQHTVLPEISELLAHALEGRVFYKYGKSQKMLESSYMLTDSLKPLVQTELGKEISELQQLYNKL